MYANYGGHKYEREHELYRVFLKQHCIILRKFNLKKKKSVKIRIRFLCRNFREKKPEFLFSSLMFNIF